MGWSAVLRGSVGCGGVRRSLVERGSVGHGSAEAASGYELGNGSALLSPEFTRRRSLRFAYSFERKDKKE